MVGLNISAGLSSVVAIYITIPFILVPQILLSGTIVQFDNLHPSVTRRVYVPVVGDLMVSRWAYEALTVEQFKKNYFEKHFFEYDQKVSNAHFISAFLVPRLQYLLEESLRLKSMDVENTSRIERNLRIIRSELIDIHLTHEVPPFEYLGMITPDGFTQEIVDEATGYLIFVRLTFNNIGNKARADRDNVYNELIGTTGADAVFSLKQQNYNKSLADWLLNNKEVNKYLETDNRIIRKFEPIFMLPSHNWGRAHFYAPAKKFNNQYVDTLWFNLSVVWLASLLLFISLQLNLLGRLFLYFETWKIRKDSKKEELILIKAPVAKEQLN
jgi:ABC transport system ATP-binding/permease protein